MELRTDKRGRIDPRREGGGRLDLKLLYSIFIFVNIFEKNVISQFSNDYIKNSYVLLGPGSFP